MATPSAAQQQPARGRSRKGAAVLKPLAPDAASPALADTAAAARRHALTSADLPASSDPSGGSAPSPAAARAPAPAQDSSSGSDASEPPPPRHEARQQDGGGAAAAQPPAGAPGALAPPAPTSAGPNAQAARGDRVGLFLSTLVLYPLAFLLAQASAGAGAAALAGVRGGIDTRERLADFPEGAALLDLECWCRERVYASWWRELTANAARLLRALLLAHLPHPIVQQVLHAPWLLQLLGLPPTPPLSQLVDEYMPHARQLLANGAPHVALRELQSRVLPTLTWIKGSLEKRHTLRRGPTPLERLDFITRFARTASALFFAWLRGLGRLCTYLSSLLSVVSGALSFTVVPSIILSVLSAAMGIAQLLLMGTADLLEPAVNGLLALTESSKDTAAALSGSVASSPVCSRVMPTATVEQLEGFFEAQLNQVSGLLNRPEIPQLTGLNKPLLVKAYDLGLIDARGRSEERLVHELLQGAAAQAPLHLLAVAASRGLVAASSLDVSAVLSAAAELGRGLASRMLPAALGGQRGSLRTLFRPDGFFSYADERTAQVALVLLCRLLSWLHLSSVVAPGSRDCLRFVLVLGEAQAGKASLFARLVDAPPEYAQQLGGGGGARGKDSPRHGTAQAAGKPPAQAAVDMRQLVGQPNTYAIVFPGLNSHDAGTRQLARALAAALGGLASAVVFLVHPASEPSPDKLALLAGSLAAGCHALVAINGPSRVRGLLGGGGAAAPPAPPPAAAAAAGLQVSDGDEAAAVPGAPPVLPTRHTPLEALRSRWQGAAEQLCALHGLPPSLLGVVVSEVCGAASAGELPPGVHQFRQVQDWVASTASQAQRVV